MSARPVILIIAVLAHGLSALKGDAELKAAAILLSTVLFWVAEVMPLAATALLIPVLSVAHGLLDMGGAFQAFSNPTIFLLIGVFLLVGAVKKTGLDLRLASRLLSNRYAATSGERLALAMTIACWLVGMWMSNTATSALFLPIALALADQMGAAAKSAEEKARIYTRLLLICAFTPSIGGMATPVGSLPNMIAMETFREHGAEISFFSWMLFAVPFSVSFLVISYVILRVLFPLNFLKQGQEGIYLATEAASLSGAERAVGIVAVVVVLLWLVPGVFSRGGYSFATSPILHPAVAALGGSLILFLVRPNWGGASRPVLETSDVQGIDWGVILLFGGGLTLGRVLESSGLAASVGQAVFSHLSGSLFLAAVSVAAAGSFLSEFCSNTASAAILVPFVVAESALIPPQYVGTLVVLTVISCGFGFLLPVSTPPNAMAFATGKIRTKDMFKAGACLDLAGVILLPLLAVLLPQWIFPALRLP